MAFCPGCGYEFREGLRRCPDCDMDLVADLDEVDGARARRLRGGKTVSVFTATREAVEMLADMLDGEGVSSIIRPVDARASERTTEMPGAPLADLHVLERDAEGYRDLIQELIAEVSAQQSEAQPTG
jgi:hypothetical protein